MAASNEPSTNEADATQALAAAGGLETVRVRTAGGNLVLELAAQQAQAMTVEGLRTQVAEAIKQDLDAVELMDGAKQLAGEATLATVAEARSVVELLLTVREVMKQLEKGKPPIEQLDTLKCMLSSRSEATQLSAAVTVRKLLSVEDGPPIANVLEAGLVPILVAICRDSETEQLQCESAWALTNIASGTTEHVSILVEEGCLQVFVDKLSSPNEDVREQCVWGIGNIAGDSCAHRDRVLEAGGMEPLLNTLRTTAEQSQSLTRNATWALSNLCRGEPAPALSSVVPSLDVLASLLVQQADDEEVVADVCWGLSYMAKISTEAAFCILQSDGWPRTMKLLSHHSTRVVQPALSVCNAVVAACPDKACEVSSHDFVVSLYTLINNGVDPIRKQAGETLADVLRQGQDQIEALVGCLDGLVSAASRRQELLKLLIAVAIGGTPDQIWAALNCGIMKALLDGLVPRDLRPDIVNTDTLQLLEAILQMLLKGAEWQVANSQAENPCCQHPSKSYVTARIEMVRSNQSLGEEIVDRAALILEVLGKMETGQAKEGGSSCRGKGSGAGTLENDGQEQDAEEEEETKLSASTLAKTPAPLGTYEEKASTGHHGQKTPFEDIFGLQVWPHKVQDDNAKHDLMTSQIKASITAKRNWKVKVLSVQVVDKWRSEAVAQGALPAAFEQAIKELANNDFYSLSGIGYTDGLFDSQLLERLRVRLDALAERSFDFHPYSNGMVRNLIHPSLYPLVRGESWPRNFIPPRYDAPTQADRMGKRSTEADRSDRFAHCLVGVEEWSRYQWLPAEVDVADDGTSKLTSYINNAPADPELRCVLEETFSKLLPLFERAVTPPETRQAVSLRGRKLQVIIKAANYELQPGQSYEGGWHVEGMLHERIVAAAIVYYGASPNMCDEGLEFRRLRNRNVVGMSRIPPNTIGDDDYGRGIEVAVEDGNWRSASVSKSLDTENKEVEPEVNESRSSEDDDYDHGDPEQVPTGFVRPKYGLSGDDVHSGSLWNVGWKTETMPNHVDLGIIATPPGRALVFKNSNQHRVGIMCNSSTDESAFRKVLVFWLVDPDKRIASTADIPMQQWNTISTQLAHTLYRQWRPLGSASALRKGIVRLILDFAKWGFTQEEALQHRLKLMEERKFSRHAVGSKFEKLIERRYSFCEH